MIPRKMTIRMNAACTSNGNELNQRWNLLTKVSLAGDGCGWIAAVDCMDPVVLISLEYSQARLPFFACSVTRYTPIWSMLKI
jgi:hypothetical protein